MTTRDGTVLASGTEASLRATVAALRGGAIVAIKGIGGYHLTCDAASCTAASVLRERKQRPDQHFAVMMRDLATARTLVDVGEAASLLTSIERPIVLLPRRRSAPVADCVAPGLDELGVLLPYAPLHHLLFDDLPDGSPGAPEALVMTSGGTVALSDASDPSQEIFVYGKPPPGQSAQSAAFWPRQSMRSVHRGATVGMIAGNLPVATAADDLMQQCLAA